MNLNIPIPEFLCDWPFYAGFVFGIVVGAVVLIYLAANIIGPFK